MIYNSKLCSSGTADNIVYPDGNGAAAGQALASGHPHGPSSIKCGSTTYPLTYDANGNTLSMPRYAAAGTVTTGLRQFAYDGENHAI